MTPLWFDFYMYTIEMEPEDAAVAIHPVDVYAMWMHTVLHS